MGGTEGRPFESLVPVGAEALYFEMRTTWDSLTKSILLYMIGFVTLLTQVMRSL